MFPTTPFDSFDLLCGQLFGLVFLFWSIVAIAVAILVLLYKIPEDRCGTDTAEVPATR